MSDYTIQDVYRSIDIIKHLNGLDLKDFVKFLEKELDRAFDKEKIDDFQFTGLNNRDFLYFMGIKWTL